MTEFLNPTRLARLLERRLARVAVRRERAETGNKGDPDLGARIPFEQHAEREGFQKPRFALETRQSVEEWTMGTCRCTIHVGGTA